MSGRNHSSGLGRLALAFLPQTASPVPPSSSADAEAQDIICNGLILLVAI